MNQWQNTVLEAGELYVFSDSTNSERLWGIFDKLNTAGHPVLEVTSWDFEHFERYVAVPPHLISVRLATRSELRDFAYNMGYQHV